MRWNAPTTKRLLLKSLYYSVPRLPFFAQGVAVVKRDSMILPRYCCAEEAPRHEGELSLHPTLFNVDISLVLSSSCLFSFTFFLLPYRFVRVYNFFLLAIVILCLIAFLSARLGVTSCTCNERRRPQPARSAAALSSLLSLFVPPKKNEEIKQSLKRPQYSVHHVN